MKKSAKIQNSCYVKPCGEQLNGFCMIVLNLVSNYAEPKTAGTKFINSSPGPGENLQIKWGQIYALEQGFAFGKIDWEQTPLSL